MNILILSASTGGGHMKAAETLKKYIENNDKEIKVELVDTLEYISPLLNRIISGGYVFLVKNFNYLYKVFYRNTDKTSIISSFVTKALTILSKKLLPLINSINPQVIVTLHPFSTEIISILKEEELIQQPQVCIITDYAAHKTWVKKNVDKYCVAWDGMINDMGIRGVSQDKIHSFGIPVSKEFFEKNEIDKQNLIEEVNLKSLKTILIMAGSFGVKNIKEIYKSLLNIELDFQIVIVTGKNKALYNSIKKINKGSKNTVIIEYTNEISRYMNLADILITKPGGLTISEAIASNVPMIIFDAIPGQEEANSKFLLTEGMAISIGKLYDCNNVVQELLLNEDKLNKLKDNCSKFDKEKSCKYILELIKEITSKNKNQNEIA